MRIVIDLQGAQTEGRFRGIGRYATSLALAMARNAGEHEIWLVLNAAFPDSIVDIRRAFAGLVADDRIRLFKTPAPAHEIDAANAWRVRAAEKVREHFIERLRPDVVLLSSLFEGLGDNAVTSVGAFSAPENTAVILYDLIPLRNQAAYLPTPAHVQCYQRKLDSLKRAGLLLAISDFSRLDAIDALGLEPDRVVNISAAIDGRFQPRNYPPGELAALQARLGLTRKMVMYAPGGFDPRKNFEGLIQAYAMLPTSVRQQHQLVIVSKIGAVDRSHLTALRKRAGLGDDEFVLTGYVSDAELVALYHLAALFVFPSIYEGFGLPALEAMACGAPTIGSNTTSVPEVIGWENALFDPARAESISARMAQVLGDEGLRTRLRQHGLRQAAKFSWDTSARCAIAQLEALPTRALKQQRRAEVDGARATHALLEAIARISTSCKPQEGDLVAVANAIEFNTQGDIASLLFVDSIEARQALPAAPLTPAIESAVNQALHEQWQQFRKSQAQERFFAAPAPRRPKLAYVSPLPPERSGISDYSAELLPQLARFYDIDVIVVQSCIGDPWIQAHCPMRSVAWLRQHAADYERVIYQFGNSTFHSHMFALLREHPGVVVLHDFFLGGVLAYEERRGAMPGAWADALYRSHGYLALKAASGPDGMQVAGNAYPCNLEVMQLARGVIVHSEHARQLVRHWYGAHAADGWSVIPHLRGPAAALDRLAARKALGISAAAFLVCSFGFVDPLKLSDRLLDAWLASRLQADPACQLVLVGSNHSGEYGAQLTQRMRAGQERIRSTGWVDAATYELYLQAADAGVQLRAMSRGETSGAVLHCLNYGLPTIVNENGSMADLPPDVVWKLPAEFDDAQLVEALETLREDRARGLELGAAARQFIRTRHDPRQCATLYAQAIEAAYDSAVQCAPARRQLLVDVSTVVRRDLHTGIERVVRAQLSELLNLAPPGLWVEPVYLSDQGGTWHYRYARSYTCKLLGIEASEAGDAPLVIGPGDVYYAPDFFPDGVLQAAQCGIYAKWRADGLTLHFMIHDLLPVLRPEFFPLHADVLHARWLACIAENADSLICVSNSVADEFRRWTAGQAATKAADITVVHHGADLAASIPSFGMPPEASRQLQQMAAAPSFLMVGTVEPRKGHLQTLAAFEQLWREGEQVQLVIVGKEGWRALPPQQRRTIPEIVERIGHHPELGKRLFWLSGISDEYLQQVYAASTCLVFASEGEGFGLPLIEAARCKLPIIARDLPVLREVAGENAYYFDGLAGADLAHAIRAWLALQARGVSPASEVMPWITWKQNAGQLLAVLAGPA